MPRRCECDKATCRPCWLWHNDARYHAHWGGPGLPTALTGAAWVAEERVPQAGVTRSTRRALPVVPCTHGDPLTVAEIRAAGRNPRKAWKRCSHPDRPKGEVVCPCTGCGPRCSGYAADAPD